MSGWVALVTGSSTGIGLQCAHALYTEGADVVLTARRSDLLAAACDALGDRASFLAGDITDPRHRSHLVEYVQHRHGRLDVLVNNAGACDDGPLENQSLDDLTSVIELNLTANLDLCRLAAPMLFDSHRASVINITSIYGTVASRNPMAAYNATKGALTNLTRHLAAQWGERGVRVNALAPGYFPTDLTGNLADPDFAAIVSARTLLGRTPSLDELDGPLLFLASPASSYVTGHVLVVDGGWTAV
jgi:NAD(P)-dependent dehydrogenase (short-subunit alcohol dehydrogenase family)